MSGATQPPFPVLVLGAGRMAHRIARMLGGDARFAPVLAMREGDGPAGVDGLNRLPPLTGSLHEALSTALRGQRAVILADTTLPAPDVARAAIAAGCHYLDIAESAASGAAIARMGPEARAAALCLAPGCGLAPGYVTALAAEALETAGPADQITVFVGVLPARPDNRLGYANIWGIEGLVREYTAPCLALKAGQAIELAALTEPETVYLNGLEFEAFTTAGSLDSLVRDHQGRVGELVFKTLRYPGHLDRILFLLADLGLAKRLYQFRTLLTTALPRTEEDRVLIAIRRRSEGCESWTSRLLCPARDAAGQAVSAASTATAAHVCATLDLIVTGRTGPGVIEPGGLRPRLLRKSPFLDLVDAAAMTNRRGGA